MVYAENSVIYRAYAYHYCMRSAKSLRISKRAAATLNQWCRSTTLPHGQIMRAKIILQLSEGMTPTEVATAQRTTAKTVHRWRNRFEAEGIDGLLERARSGRPTVIDLCRKYSRSRRLFPIGRLDFNTTGAILLTNDGALCYRLTHPRFEIPKTYQVRVRGVMNEAKLRKLERLATTSRRARPARSPVDLVRSMNKESIIRITLREGRNRQVRRMCEAVEQAWVSVQP